MVRIPYIYGMNACHRNPPGRRLITTLTAGISLLLAAWIVVSCSSSTDPGGGDEPTQISFSPSSDTVTVQIGQDTLFEVVTNDGTTPLAQWSRDGQVVHEGLQYSYNSVELGIDSLAVTVAIPGDPRQRSWTIVREGALPPSVSVASIEHGPEAVTIEISWQRIVPSQAPNPIAEYLVAVAYDGPITTENWDDAILLDSVASDSNLIMYTRQFSEEDGLLPGQEAWFAIRARDELDLVSPVNAAQNRTLRITAPYHLYGTVVDDAGNPLSTVIVNYGCDTCKVVTDVEGNWTLGPFRDIDRFVLFTATDNENSGPGVVDAYYDFVTDTLSVASAMPLEIMLIGRHGLAVACEDPGENYQGSFLTFFRDLTRTNLQALNGGRLWKWESYPVTVYVPAGISDNGIDLQEQARISLQNWNDAVFTPVFTETDDPNNADVVIEFVAPGQGQIGLTNVVLPSGNVINEVIPEQILVQVTPGLNTLQVSREVLMHELGHALCFGGHSECGFGVHLMYIWPIGMFDITGEDGAISLDERNAVRCLVNLPQGVDMDQFIVGTTP